MEGEYTIKFYANSATGKSDVHEYVVRLDIKTKAKVEKYLRIFYFSFVGKTIILLHAFFKKTPKTPPQEIKRALDNYYDFITNQNAYEY